ncbi:hypothetical protein QTO34_004177 [Cnephaeus nilssonii]|uniref:Uncharacterized protein n=1 Tax=Cnephaeus nilssonii TaxID=3371016 RepID=A0AA40HS14_CNENI|nr:hypothetical protein QTO34_004177 [Eptesicus nilssonii]
MQVSGPTAKPSNPFLSTEAKTPQCPSTWKALSPTDRQGLVAQGHPSQKAPLKACDFSDPNQIYIYNGESDLVLSNLHCLDMSETQSSDPPRLMTCHGQEDPSSGPLGRVIGCPGVRWTVPESGRSTSHNSHVAMAIYDSSSSQQWHLEVAPQRQVTGCSCSRKEGQQAGGARLAKAGASRGPLIAPLVTPQIIPDCWPGLGPYPCTNFVHRASSFL